MRTFEAHTVNTSFKLQAPFTLLVSGSSGVGKTFFIERILKHNKIDPVVKTVYYHYPEELSSIPVQAWIKYFNNIKSKTKLLNSFNWDYILFYKVAS